MGTNRPWRVRNKQGTEIVDAVADEELVVHAAVTDLNAASEESLLEVASRSAAKGRRTTAVIAALPALDSLTERLEKSGVFVHRFGAGYDACSDHMRAFGEARQLFRLLVPRLVHFHGRWAPTAWDATLAARAAGVRTIVRTEQEPVPSLLVERHRTTVRLVNAAIAHVVFVSRGAARVHLTGDGHWFKNWSIIPDGAPFESIDREVRGRARASLGLPSHGLVAAMAAHSEARNGPLDFIRAAAAAVRKGSALHFVVAGDGPFRAEAEQLAAAVGIAGRLHFVRADGDERTSFAAYDVRVHEGPTAVLIEGLTAGIPRMNLRGQGASDALASPHATAVCEPGDVAAMTQGLLAIENEEGIQRRFVDRMDPRRLCDHSYEAIQEEYEHLYKKLGLSRRSGEIASPVSSSRTLVLV